jgi:uncharacterized protein with FMN-binding domain
MRRGVMAVVATAIGATLMVGAKIGHRSADSDLAGQTSADGQPAADGDGQAQVIVSGTPVPAPNASGSVAAPKPGATSAKPGPSRTARSAPASTPPKPSPAGQYKDGTYAGPAVTEHYGVIKVTITVSGGKIASASATCSNPCSGESASISSNAIGRLNRAVVTAQSASVSSVSGATFTSTAYKTSLASAVNAAKA